MNSHNSGPLTGDEIGLVSGQIVPGSGLAHRNGPAISRPPARGLRYRRFQLQDSAFKGACAPFRRDRRTEGLTVRGGRTREETPWVAQLF
jgi:hypothetical protein